LHPRAFAFHCIEHSLGQFRPQTGWVSDEDDAARFLAGGEYQLSEVLIFGQENSALARSEPDHVFVVRTG